MVSDRKAADFNLTACLFDEFGKGIEVAASAVVMNRDNRVVVIFCERTDYVLHTLLHFGVGALNGVELDA